MQLKSHINTWFYKLIDAKINTPKTYLYMFRDNILFERTLDAIKIISTYLTYPFRIYNGDHILVETNGLKIDNETELSLALANFNSLCNVLVLRDHIEYTSKLQFHLERGNIVSMIGNEFMVCDNLDTDIIRNTKILAKSFKDDGLWIVNWLKSSDTNWYVTYMAKLEHQ